MEYRKICEVCGNYFCFTDEDLRKNRNEQLLSGISSLGAASGALAGNWGAALANQSQGQNAEKKIKDFDHCPNCNSIKLRMLAPSEWEDIKKRKAINSNGGISVNTNASEDNLIKRVELFLEQKDFVSADAYIEKILDISPENGYVYFLKLLCENRVTSRDDLVRLNNISDSTSYKLARRYGDSNIQKDLDIVIEKISQRLLKEKESEKEAQYIMAVNYITSNKTQVDEDLLKTHLLILESLGDYKDAKTMISTANEMIETRHKNNKKMVIILVIGCIFAGILLFGAVKYDEIQKAKQKEIAKQEAIAEKEEQFEKVMSLIEKGFYKQAYDLMDSAGCNTNAKMLLNDVINLTEDGFDVSMSDVVSELNFLKEDTKYKSLCEQVEKNEYYNIYLSLVGTYSEGNERIDINQDGTAQHYYADLDKVKLTEPLYHNKDKFYFSMGERDYDIISWSDDYQIIDVEYRDSLHCLFRE